MNIKALGLNELLFIFLNVKAYNNDSKVIKNRGDIHAKYFQADSSIRSKKGPKIFITPPFTSKTLSNQLEALNSYYNFNGPTFIASGRKSIKIQFKNDNNLTLSELLNKIFEEISKKSFVTSKYNFSKLFAINAFGFRGSFDYSHGLFTVDIHSSRVKSKNYIGNITKLLTSINFSNQLNLNFRDLQKEELSGKKFRAPQFRINLRYFNDNYLNLLKHVNPYRYKQFMVNSKLLLRKSSFKHDNSYVLNRLIFYHNHILNKNHIDKYDISKMRKQLNFDKPQKKNGRQRRSSAAKNFVLVNAPERCASCQHIYKRSVRTFPLKGTHKKYWYFEIHHVISHAVNGINTEKISNLVKLCPTCHRALTPGIAENSYQRKIIRNILRNEPKVRKYIKFVQKSLDNHQDPITFIQGKLR